MEAPLPPPSHTPIRNGRASLAASQEVEETAALRRPLPVFLIDMKRAKPGTAKPKKDRGKRDEFATFATVDTLGAMDGQRIRGVLKRDKNAEVVKPEEKFFSQVEGVVLEVARGGVKPMAEARRAARMAYGGDPASVDGWAEKLGGFLSISKSRAVELIQLMETQKSEGEKGFLGMRGDLNSANKPPFHVVGGEEVRFKIVEPGAWGDYEEIQSIVEEERLVSPGEIYDALNNGKKASEEQNPPGPYCLQRNLFIHVSGSSEVVHNEGDTVDVEVAGVLSPAEPAVYYDIGAEFDDKGQQSKLRMKLPPSRPGRFTVEEARAISDQCVDVMLSKEYHYVEQDDDGNKHTTSLLFGLTPGQAHEQVGMAFGVLTHSSMTGGPLKSLLQKALRYGAATTLLPDGVTAVDTRIVALATVSLIYAIKSTFMPDLGLHVRGCTNASKRLAVIMVEDAWPRMGMLRGMQMLNKGLFNPGRVLASLMGVALATSRMPTYSPPDSVILSSMMVAVACHQSDEIIDWREGPFVGLSHSQTRANKQGMHMGARLLRIVRSFDGDMEMLETAADMTTDDGRVRVLYTGNVPTAVMPLKHMIDQHVWRGTGFTTKEGADTFAKRHEAMFRYCTGWNPRLSKDGAMLNEQDAAVRIIRTQQQMIQTMLFPPSGLDAMDVTVDRTFSIPLDTGVMSGGVGPIPVTVTTTQQENVKDGFKDASHKWNVLVIIGVESAEEIVMHSVNARDNDKKPIITKTAKQKAVAKAREATPFSFSSSMLRGYSKVRFRNGSWEVLQSDAASRELEPIVWGYGSETIAVQYARLPPVADSLMESFEHDLMLERLNYCLRVPKNTPGIADGYEQSVAVALDALAEEAETQRLVGRTLQLRLFATIRGQYNEVALPTPNKDGGLGADKLSAMNGDWLVYLTLLKIASLVPGALRPKMSPKFDVVDARTLRALEMTIANYLATPVEAAWQLNFQAALDSFEARLDTPAIGGRDLFDYQTALINKMLARDESAVVKPRGHFVNLDTGLGKSITAATYMLKYGARYGNAARIIWFTPSNVVDTTVDELSQTWGFGRSAVGVVDEHHPALKCMFNLVPMEKLSTSSTLSDALIRAAETSFVVVDEVHRSYRVSKRTSAIRSVVEACPRFVAMTATPVPDRGEVIGERWIADSVGFPLVKQNFLVGAAQMVGAKVELPIEAEEKILPVDLSNTDSAKHMEFLRNGGGWAEAAQHVRRATFFTMGAKAIELADKDRAANPGGGVLMFMDNEEEAEAMRRQLALAVVGKNYSVGMRAGNELNEQVGIAITTKRDVAGYNFIRMGAIVTGVYAESAASRHQLRGRIRRIGQKRSVVEYWTVFARNTILNMLFDRHNTVDAKNASLEQLAKDFVTKSKTT